MKRFARVWAVGGLLTVFVGGCCMLRGAPDGVFGERGTGRETVVFVHGMRRTPRSFARLEQVCRAAGYQTLQAAYSSNEPVEATAERLAAELLPAIRGLPRVHFVTHSLGGILVREIFRRHGIPENLGRTVMLSPPNGGSEQIDNFSWLPFFPAIWGRPGPELGTDPESFPNRLPPIDFPCWVIAGTSGRFLGLFIRAENDGKVSVPSAFAAPGIEDRLVLPVNHTTMMKDPAVMDAVLSVLQTGRFPGGQAEPPGAVAAAR